MLIVFGICIAAIAVGSGLYFYGPSELRQSPGVTGGEASALSAEETVIVPFTVLSEGMSAVDVSERKNYAVYNETEFARLWRMAYGPDATDMPGVDFDKDYVVGVFAGEKPTGGYAIEVSGIEDANTVRTVSVTISRPAEGCVATQALTSPFQFVAVPASDRDHARAEEEVEVGCE